VRPSQYLGEGAWRLPGRLDSLSTLMWRCERDPMLRPALVMVVLLDRPPDPGRFAAGHEWATRMVPRLRERPVAPLLTPTMPLWAPDPEFDIARHLRRAGLPSPAGRRELFDLAQELAATPFDLRRPVWESVLVEDLRGEREPYRAAWLVKFHHCLADGPLVSYWLSALLNRGREPRADKPQPPAPARRLETVPEQLIGPITADAAPAARRMARGALAALRTPISTALGMGADARTLADVLTRPAGRPSPLLRARGTTRRFEGVPIDLDGLRSAARNAEVSVNAAYCAGLLSGLRHYHAAHGVTAASVSAAMTIPVRRPGPRIGNQFNGAKFPGPLDVPDPRALCRAVDTMLARAAVPFPPSTLDLVLTGVNQVPDAVLSRLARSLGRSLDLQVSHVVAPTRAAYVSGARLEEVWCFGPAPGCAVMALMVSRRRTATLGLTLDTAAVPDPTTFRECVETGFAEVIGSRDPGPGPGPGPGSRPGPGPRLSRPGK
jgi:diacylglycerol O-acyltransferase / wax synthase